MKYSNPLEFLAGGTLARFIVRAFSRRASFLLALLLVAVLCFDALAKPPQAPPLQPVSRPCPKCEACKDCPCGIDGCPCGRCDGRGCVCKGRDPEYAEFLAWKRSRGRTAVAELNKPYAKEWQADGWTYDEARGYWTKPAPTAAPPLQFYQPQMFAPMPSFGGFGGGMMGGGGCAGGSCGGGG